MAESLIEPKLPEGDTYPSEEIYCQQHVFEFPLDNISSAKALFIPGLSPARMYNECTASQFMGYSSLQL